MPTVITGTDGINQVQAGAVESGDLASGAIGSGDLPAGSVIQVKHVVTRTNVTVNAPNTLVDLGLSIQITPTSTNSKFLLFCKIHAHLGNATPSGYGLVWFRNNNEVRSPVKYFEVYSDNNAYHASHFQYLDIPQTGSTITYEAKPETYSDDKVEFSNSGYYDHNLTVMEIAG